MADAARGPATRPRIVQSHGHLLLVGAGGGFAPHHEARVFLRPEGVRGAAREAAAIDRDRAFVLAHEHRFHSVWVRDFTPEELVVWGGGVWRYEWHYGRLGWWWDAGDVWYPYEVPVYPYPDQVVPLQVYETVTVEGPVPAGYAGYRQPDAPANGTNVALNIAPLPAPPSGWYRCNVASGNYYPTVMSCVSSWELVQDAPPVAAVQAVTTTAPQ